MITLAVDTNDQNPDGVTTFNEIKLAIAAIPEDMADDYTITVTGGAEANAQVSVPAKTGGFTIYIEALDDTQAAQITGWKSDRYSAERTGLSLGAISAKVKIRRVQLKFTGNGSAGRDAISSGGNEGELELDRCRLECVGVSGATTTGVLANYGKVRLVNTLLVGRGDDILRALNANRSGDEIVVENCVLYGFEVGCRYVSSTVIEFRNTAFPSIADAFDGAVSPLLEGCAGDDAEFDPGSGNNIQPTDWDAAFKAAASGDFSMIDGSELVDSGIEVLAASPDMKGTPRPQGSAYDIGADEFVPVVIPSYRVKAIGPGGSYISPVEIEVIQP